MGDSNYGKKGQKDLRTTKKMMKNGTIEEVIEHLINLLCDFSIHNLTNINQLHNFKQAKKNLKPNELIISEDFSENYSLKHQNEIMSAHWSQEELSLFLCNSPLSERWKTSFQTLLCFMFWRLSTWQKHHIFYNSYIVNDLKSQGSSFYMVHYWSDGPSSQFKNQFNFTNLKFHEKDHGMPADWNFFTTSHSKGGNDGAGGDVKIQFGERYFRENQLLVILNCFLHWPKANILNSLLRGLKQQRFVKQPNI